MARKTGHWDAAYRTQNPAWGMVPDRMLTAHAHLIAPGTILDLGVGDGRNALYFGKKGYTVEGIDLSETAVKLFTARAKKMNIAVRARVGDIRTVELPENTYTLIIAAWIFQFMILSDAVKIIHQIEKGLHDNGFVYAGVFSIQDPGLKRARKTLKTIDRYTFYDDHNDSYIHYFTKKEIRGLFRNFKTICIADGYALDTSHESTPHYHGFIEYFGKKGTRP